MNLPSEIVTERLVLRPITLAYAEDINRELTEQVTRYMYPKPAPLEETIKYVQEAITANESVNRLELVILDNTSFEFIGGGGLQHIDTRTPEFGIWIKESSCGHHYGREAIEGIKRWADKNLDFDYLLYPADISNIPSRKVAEHIGGVFEREYDDKNVLGEDIHLVEYRIYKEQK